MRSVRTVRRRVGPILGMLAVVPLAGLVFLAIGRISEVQTTNRQLGELDAATSELVQLVELEAALQNERFWVGTSFAVEQLGFPTDIVAALLGIDPVKASTNAQAWTDDLVAAVELPGLDEAMDQVRSSPPDLSGRSTEGEQLAERLVRDALNRKANQVVGSAAQQSDGASLVELARTLELANDVRSGFSEVRATFFTNYGDLDDTTERRQIRVLTSRLESYRDGLVDLERLAAGRETIAAPLAELLVDPDRLALVAEAESLMAESDARFDSTPRLSDDPGRLRPIGSTFTTAEAASTRHLEFVALTAEALQADVSRARSDAARTAWWFASLAAAVSFVTIGAIAVATRWIVRPLIDLGGTALALTEGGQGSLMPARGPAEMRLIHDALTEAISNLERTEQQAIALADGALDDPSLNQPVPGRFGATLHAAIEQLRRSIGHQERFSDQLAFEAAHDGLTGLFNRRAVLDALRQALTGTTEGSTTRGVEGEYATVFFVDLDHFKNVNDTMGHAAGDDVLRAVADALRTNARPGDAVGRIGGDEFLVVSTTLTSVDQATRLAERFLAAVKQSLSSDGSQIGASIGVAMGAVGRDVDALLAEADVAMLDAKKRGRNAVRFFDAELRGRTTEELNLTADIRSGLSDEQFELHYQPIVDSVSGHVLDYEALIRWEHPTKGRVMPDDYIPFAEGSDLVIDIDRWVLSSAVDTIASGRLDGVGVAVNISGRHLANGDLFSDLEAVLNRTPINPAELTIEITESALLGDIDGAIDTLRRIRQIGVKVAIDDFGTGYTSLTHLRNLPADVLKIDQSFTNDLDNPDDANLIRLVIQTAHILGLDVVVEGVETLHQAQRVTMLGADQMQGYYFAKPMSLDDVTASDDLTTHPTASHR